jgi:hypothetical protein
MQRQQSNRGVRESPLKIIVDIANVQVSHTDDFYNGLKVVSLDMPVRTYTSLLLFLHLFIFAIEFVTVIQTSNKCFAKNASIHNFLG